jgi:hypothetical protein
VPTSSSRAARHLSRHRHHGAVDCPGLPQMLKDNCPEAASGGSRSETSSRVRPGHLKFGGRMAIFGIMGEHREAAGRRWALAKLHQFNHLIMEPCVDNTAGADDALRSTGPSFAYAKTFWRILSLTAGRSLLMSSRDELRAVACRLDDLLPGAASSTASPLIPTYAACWRNAETLRPCAWLPRKQSVAPLRGDPGLNRGKPPASRPLSAFSFPFPAELLIALTSRHSAAPPRHNSRA